MRKSSVWFFCLAAIVLGVLGVLPDVWAADLHHEAEEIGKSLGVIWVVPFACMLLSIAIMPLAVPHFWHHHYGKVSAFWGLAFLVPFALVHGFDLAVYSVAHTLFLEYISFIVLLFSLFTIAGGVCLRGSLVGKPQVNTVILLIGTLLASWMGTTGAAMLLIRPSCAPSITASTRCTPSSFSSSWWPTSAAV
jgi:Na+/H+ antiporter NhaD/arsenite permease-like protein